MGHTQLCGSVSASLDSTWSWFSSTWTAWTSFRSGRAPWLLLKANAKRLVRTDWEVNYHLNYHEIILFRAQTLSWELSGRWLSERSPSLMGWLCGGNGCFNEASQVQPRSPLHGTTSIIHLASPHSDITLKKPRKGWGSVSFRPNRDKSFCFFNIADFFVCLFWHHAFVSKNMELFFNLLMADLIRFSGFYHFS